MHQTTVTLGRISHNFEVGQKGNLGLDGTEQAYYGLFNGDHMSV